MSKRKLRADRNPLRCRMTPADEETLQTLQHSLGLPLTPMVAPLQASPGPQPPSPCTSPPPAMLSPPQPMDASKQPHRGSDLDRLLMELARADQAKQVGGSAADNFAVAAPRLRVASPGTRFL
jgi:hypothetical protein